MIDTVEPTAAARFRANRRVSLCRGAHRLAAELTGRLLPPLAIAATFPVIVSPISRWFAQIEHTARVRVAGELANPSLGSASTLKNAKAEWRFRVHGPRAKRSGRVQPSLI